LLSDNVVSRNLRVLLYPLHQDERSIIGFLDGGASQTRTGDTRLFRASENAVFPSLTDIRKLALVRYQVCMLGGVAINVAVNSPLGRTAVAAVAGAGSASITRY
jgi:hypothetical protein